MRLPHINWTKVGEHLAACDPYAAVLLADGTIGTRDGETIVASRQTTEPDVSRERYEAWCRRGARAIQPVAAAR